MFAGDCDYIYIVKLATKELYVSSCYQVQVPVSFSVGKIVSYPILPQVFHRLEFSKASSRKVYDYNEGSCPVAHTADSVYRFH